jgi:hypothetical protein
MYVEGQWIAITKNGQGTAPSDVGLVCRIAKIYEEGKSPARYKHYTIEIDRDKEEIECHRNKKNVIKFW